MSADDGFTLWDPAMFTGLSGDAATATVAHTLPVTAAALSDAEWVRNTLTIRMEDHMDRLRNPWRYPDRNRFPEVRWWPLVERAEWWWANYRTEVPERLSGAWSVLRHGVTEHDEDDW